MYGGSGRGEGVCMGGQEEGRGYVWGVRKRGGDMYGGSGRGEGVCMGGQEEGRGYVWGVRKRGGGMYGGSGRGEGVCMGGNFMADIHDWMSFYRPLETVD